MATRRKRAKSRRKPSKKKGWLAAQTHANKNFLDSIGLGFLSAPVKKVRRATKKLTNKTISKIRSLKYV